MLEILLLIFLSKKIGTMAETKGHSKVTYRVLTFVSWFFFEFVGAIIGLLIFGNNGYEFYLIGLLCAVGGYGLMYVIVNALPDKNPTDMHGQTNPFEPHQNS
jgi:hypothetical protein